MRITTESHLDHGLTPAHVAWLTELFAEREAFFVETVEIPSELSPLTCGLHGPATGGEPVPESEVHYARRGQRAGESRLCRRPPQETRLVTVVAGPDGDEPCVLYTAYGGPSAPRESWDETLDDAGRAESSAFWRLHALSAET